MLGKFAPAATSQARARRRPPKGALPSQAMEPCIGRFPRLKALRWRGRLARKAEVLNDFEEAAKWGLIGIPQRCPAANERRAR